MNADEYMKLAESLVGKDRLTIAIALMELEMDSWKRGFKDAQDIVNKVRRES
jgi:hypothetical protein